MKLFIKRLLSFFPTPLPVGMQEFETWAKSIRDISGAGLDKVPQDQFKWVLASAVQHLKQTEASVPKRYFVNVIRKGAATQIAGQVFMEVKQKQEAAQKAELEALQAQEAAKLAEATAQQPSVAASDVEPAKA